MSKKVNRIVKKSIVLENKKCYDSISKIGKSITKCKWFGNAPSGVDIDTIDFGNKVDKSNINEIISKHLFISGKFEAGEQFCEESGVHLEEDFKNNFRVLDEILTQINEKKLEKVFKWVNENESRLKIAESDVPFLAHKVHFCSMLKKAEGLGKGEEQTEFLSEMTEYAKRVFPQLFAKYRNQIFKLMGSFVFINNIKNSKYHDLVTDLHWNHLTQNFVRDFCKIQGSEKDSGMTQYNEYSGEFTIF